MEHDMFHRRKSDGLKPSLSSGPCRQSCSSNHNFLAIMPCLVAADETVLLCWCVVALCASHSDSIQLLNLFHHCSHNTIIKAIKHSNIVR